MVPWVCSPVLAPGIRDRNAVPRRPGRGSLDEARWHQDMALQGVAPTTEMRTGLVSGTVNTDMVISIDRFAETHAERRTASGGRGLAGAARRLVFKRYRQEEQ